MKLKVNRKVHIKLTNKEAKMLAFVASYLDRSTIEQLIKDNTSTWFKPVSNADELFNFIYEIYEALDNEGVYGTI